MLEADILLLGWSFHRHSTTHLTDLQSLLWRFFGENMRNAKILTSRGFSFFFEAFANAL